MNQVKETKFGLKSLPILLCVAALLFGGGVLLVETLWMIPVIEDVFSSFEFGLLGLVYRMVDMAHSFVITVVFPLVLLFAMLSFFKKGKAPLLLPLTFGVVAVHALIFELFSPIFLAFAEMLIYEYTLPFDVFLKLFLVGATNIDFMSVLQRLVEIGVLVWFGAGAVLAFMKRKTKFTENAFKGATVLGALCGVLNPVVLAIFTLYRHLFVYGEIGYTLGGVLGPVAQIAYHLFSIGAAFTSMAALVIFVLMKKPSAPVDGERIQSL